LELIKQKAKRKMEKRHRLFAAAAFASAVLLVLTFALWLAAFAVSPWDHHLSVATSFHIGVWGGVDGPTFGRLVFFNDDEYGPYRGSVVALSDAQGNVSPAYRVSAWGDSYGVYYRHFYFPGSDKTLWTLMISLLYPFALFAVLPLTWCWRQWRTGRTGDVQNGP
jgi:hypothetical protein